jgi:hypothetical protein
VTTALLARLFPGSCSAPWLRCEHPAFCCPGRGGARNEHAVRVAQRGGRRCCYFWPLRRCQIHGYIARPFRRKQGARAPRCTVALAGAAQVLALFLLRKEVRPAACAPFLPNHPVLCPPHPKAAAAALVATFATAARFSRFHIPTPYQTQLGAASARFWRKIGSPRAVRSHPVNCACIRGWVLPRTDGNQRAISTTCRTGGVQFAFQRNNARACRVAPHLRQYLARGVGFWCHQIRRCGGAGNCRIKHDRGYCRTRELLALLRLVFGRPCGVYTRW